MKTLKNIFEIRSDKRSIFCFSEKLDITAMQAIKGGDGDDSDDDTWPPTSTGTGSTGSNGN